MFFTGLTDCPSGLLVWLQSHLVGGRVLISLDVEEIGKEHFLRWRGFFWIQFVCSVKAYFKSVEDFISAS